MAPLMQNSSLASSHPPKEEAWPIARRVEIWDRAFSRLRSTLRASGLREVSTKVRVPAPVVAAGIQPLLAPPEYLATSAGPAMKRLLCFSSGPIFQISHVFRAAEPSPQQSEELHLLEWYRHHDEPAALLGDVEQLVADCLAAAEGSAPRAWRRVGFFDVVEETLGLRLRGDESAAELRDRLCAVADGLALLRHAPLSSSAHEHSKELAAALASVLTLGAWEAFLSAWGDRYLAPWLRAQVGVGVHLCDYPAVLGAQAAVGEAGWGLPRSARHPRAHRFVSYYGGVECASGYRALRDPEELLRRMQLANQLRELQGRLPLPPDHSLLSALREPGLPSCAGAALSLDRVLLLALPAADLRQISTLLGASPSPALRAGAIGGAAQLVAEGLAAADELEALSEVESRLAITIPPTMRRLIGRRDDPLGRQFVPDPRELQMAPEERSDPIGDEVHGVQPGLIHRYADRVLLKPTHLCSVYCRFCFRRDVVGDPATATLGAGALAAAIETIRQRPQIWEVILTGGDPLVLAPTRLAALLTSLREIPHVRVLRIHSRVPLVAPERITPTLLRALRGGKPLYVVLHTNHAAEFTPAGAAACAALIDSGIPMLSQTVLLRGVNDTTEALSNLMRTLVAQRIKPYYLHHPDLVAGTSHLRVSLAEGRALVASLRGRVSGLCQPVYVLDIPGGFGKVPAGQAWIEGPDADGAWRVTDPSGTVHRYVEPDPSQVAGKPPETAA